MKYCSKCGNEVDDEAVVCTKCGCQIGSCNTATPQSNGWAIAGFVCSFFIPLLGWIFGGLGIAKANKLDGKGKSLSIAAIIIASAIFLIAFISLL